MYAEYHTFQFREGVGQFINSSFNAPSLSDSPLIFPAPWPWVSPGVPYPIRRHNSSLSIALGVIIGNYYHFLLLYYFFFFFFCLLFIVLCRCLYLCCYCCLHIVDCKKRFVQETRCHIPCSNCYWGT